MTRPSRTNLSAEQALGRKVPLRRSSGKKQVAAVGGIKPFGAATRELIYLSLDDLITAPRGSTLSFARPAR